MQESVELLRQARAEIVAGSFRVGSIDHADRALESRRRQHLVDTLRAQLQLKLPDANVVKEPFVAAGQRWSNALALRGFIPVRRRGDGAAVRGEANQVRAGSMRLSYELAEVEL